MTAVTRFPHYHQAENMVTNHVMVMLRLLYDASPKLLEALLQALCASDITIGPRFSQQVAGAHSVPDGLILQEPLAVFVETKLGSMPDPDQLKRHCQTIVERLPGRVGSILISLTAGRAGYTLPAEVESLAHEHRVTLVLTTFGEFVEQIAQLPINNLVMRETIQEFIDFISVQNLVPREDQRMAAVLTGTSWRHNVKNKVYFEQVVRSAKWRQAAFLGLYHDKQLSHIGRIVTVVTGFVNEANDLALNEPELGTLGEMGLRTIRDAIADAQAYYPDFELIEHRYYLVDDFTPTNFRKISPGGMMGHRYFDLEKIGRKRLSPGTNGAAASAAIDGQSFE